MGKHYFGLTGSSRAWLVAEQAALHPHMLVLVKDQKALEALESDLRFFLGTDRVLAFLDWDILPLFLGNKILYAKFTCKTQ